MHMEKIIREIPSLLTLKINELNTDTIGIAYLDILAEV